MLTQQELVQLYSYDPETGFFYHGKNRLRAKEGVKTGTKSHLGYILITVNGKTQKAHRLAWLYVYGKWPCLGIDHINGDPSDNRIANLRLANQSQNIANAKVFKTNKFGIKGVTIRKDTNRWTARITVNYKNISLGCFDSFDEAKNAYQKASKQYFGNFASDGIR